LPRTSDLALPDGRRRVVRHGHDPVRTIQTGIGPVKVQKPKARDRSAPEAGERIRFTSSISTKMGAAHEEPRRAPAGSLSARDFGGRFQRFSRLARQGRAKPLAGSDRPGSRRVEDRVSRPVAKARFVGTPLRLRVANGVYLQARMESHKRCMLVLIGATPEGKKELIGFPDWHAGERAELEGMLVV